MNHLYVCSVCQVEIEALAKRRKVEIDTFIKVPRALPGTEEPCAAGGGGLVSLHCCWWPVVGRAVVQGQDVVCFSVCVLGVEPPALH